MIQYRWCFKANQEGAFQSGMLGAENTTNHQLQWTEILPPLSIRPYPSDTRHL
jgi:hypothetical protein